MLYRVKIICLGKQSRSQTLALKCKRFRLCHNSYIIIRIQPVGTLEGIQGIIFNSEIVCLPKLIVTVGWGCFGNNASLAYNIYIFIIIIIFLLLLSFIIRLLAQLLHTTANYQDSLVIQVKALIF